MAIIPAKFAVVETKSKPTLSDKVVKIGTVERNYTIYNPDIYVNTPELPRKDRSANIIVLTNGETAAQCLEKGGWADIAKRDNIVIFFIEPLNGKWTLDGTDDINFINAVYKDGLPDPNAFLLWNSYRYLVGYGEGGTLGHKFAMTYPNYFAGFVSVDGSAVNDDFIAAVGKVPSMDDKTILKQDVSLPVWVINGQAASNNTKVIDYWKSVNRVDETSSDNGIAVVFKRTRAENNVNKETIEEVWVSDNPCMADRYDKDLSEKIWTNFLKRFIRYMGSPNGDLRTKKSIQEMGLVRETKVIDGYTREWLEYIPTSVKSNPSKKVPLVIASGGSTVTGYWFANQSLWYQVAEARGFILIHPTALPNPDRDRNFLPQWNILYNPETKGDDVKFAMEIIEDIKGRYSIDDKRVYATGHSLGSMYTYLLGMAKPDVFAAIAPCSGRLISKFEGVYRLSMVRKDLIMPVWADLGENEGGTILVGDDTEITLKYFRNVDKIPAGAVPVYEKAGIYNVDTYFDATGKIPLISYTNVDLMPHTMMPALAWKIWDEFFSKFSRNPDGTINYNGESGAAITSGKPGTITKARTVFKDMVGNWAEFNLGRFVARGLLSPYSDGTIRPEGTMTRAEYVQLICKVFGIAPSAENGVYSDVNADAVFIPDVNATKTDGTINSYSDGTFKPDNAVTREEAAYILAKAGKDKIKATRKSIEFSDNDAIAGWAKESVDLLIKAKIFDGYDGGAFKPQNSISRAEIVKILSRFVK